LGAVPEGMVRGLVAVPRVTRPRPAAHRLVRSHLAHVSVQHGQVGVGHAAEPDRKSTRLNSSHGSISYAVFCLKKKTISKKDRSKKNTGDRRIKLRGATRSNPKAESVAMNILQRMTDNETT